MQRRNSFFLFILNSPKLMHSSHFSSCQNETNTDDVKGNEENVLKKEKREREADDARDTKRRIETTVTNASHKQITPSASEHTRKRKRKRKKQTNKQTEERETVKLIDTSSYSEPPESVGRGSNPLPQQPRLEQPTESESESPHRDHSLTDRILI